MNRPSRIKAVIVALCSAAAPNALAERPLVTNQTKLETPVNHGGFPAFAFSPDGKLVAGGTGAITMTFNGRMSVDGGEVVLWNAQTGKLVRTLGKHGGSVRWLGFSHDGKTLISASRENGVIKVWQLPAGKLRHTLKIAPAEKTIDTRWPKITLSDDGQTLVTLSPRVIPLGGESHATTGGELTVWDLKSGKQLWSKPDSDAYAAALTPDGRGMVTVQQTLVDVGTDDQGRSRFRTELALVSWNVKTEKVLETADLGRIGTPSAIKLLDAKRVALVTGSGLSIHNRKTGEATHQIQWAKERSFGDAFISDDGRMVGRAKPGFLELVDVESGDTKALTTTEFPNHLWNATFSPDLALAAGHNSGAGGGPVLLELAQQ